MLNLSYANAFNLVTSKIWSYGKGLIHEPELEIAFENVVGKAERACNQQFFNVCFFFRFGNEFHH